MSVAQVALMLVKQVDPKRYTAVESTLTGISFSSRQDVGELKHFLEAVITAIESVIQTEQTTPSEAP